MFWQRFMQLCSERNTSPNAVIAELGCVSSGAVTGWKKGSKPRDQVIIKIANYFGVSDSWLKGETDIKNPATQSVQRENPDLDRLISLLKDADPNEVQDVARYAEFLMSKK